MASSDKSQAENTRGEVAEWEQPNWRGMYRLDYERDADTGRIKEFRLINDGGDLFADETLVVSATPDGFLYIGPAE